MLLPSPRTHRRKKRYFSRQGSHPLLIRKQQLPSTNSANLTVISVLQLILHGCVYFPLCSTLHIAQCYFDATTTAIQKSGAFSATTCIDLGVDLGCASLHAFFIEQVVCGRIWMAIFIGCVWTTARQSSDRGGGWDIAA